jgi:hypothetical protein
MRQYSTVLSVNREDKLVTEGQQFGNIGYHIRYGPSQMQVVFIKWNMHLKNM